MKRSRSLLLLLICLSFLPVFSGYANRRCSCVKRAAIIVGHGATIISSGIVFMGGLFVTYKAPAEPTVQSNSRDLVPGTGALLLTLGVNGIFQGFRSLFLEIEAGDNSDDESEQQEEQSDLEQNGDPKED